MSRSHSGRPKNTVATSTGVNVAQIGWGDTGLPRSSISQRSRIKSTEKSLDEIHGKLLSPSLAIDSFAPEWDQIFSTEIPEFSLTPLFPDPSKVPAGLPHNYAEDEIAKIVEKMRKKTEKHMLKHLKLGHSLDRRPKSPHPTGTKGKYTKVNEAENGKQGSFESIEQFRPPPRPAKAVSRLKSQNCDGVDSFFNKGGFFLPHKRCETVADSKAASLAKSLALNKDPFEWLEEEAKAEGIVFTEIYDGLTLDSLRHTPKQVPASLLASPVMIERRGKASKCHGEGDTKDERACSTEVIGIGSGAKHVQCTDLLSQDSPDLDTTPEASPSPNINAPQVQRDSSEPASTTALRGESSETISVQSQRVYVDNWESAWDGCGLSRYPNPRAPASVPSSCSGVASNLAITTDQPPLLSVSATPRLPRASSAPMVAQRGETITVAHNKRAYTADTGYADAHRKFLVDASSSSPAPVLSESLPLGPLHPDLKTISSLCPLAVSTPEHRTIEASNESFVETTRQLASLGPSDWRPPTAWDVRDWKSPVERLSANRFDSETSLFELSPAGSWGSLPELSPVGHPASLSEAGVEEARVDTLTTPRQGDFARCGFPIECLNKSKERELIASVSSESGRASVSPDLIRRKHNFSRPIRHPGMRESHQGVEPVVRGLGIVNVPAPPSLQLPPIPATEVRYGEGGTSKPSDEWKAGLAWFQAPSPVNTSLSLACGSVVSSRIPPKKVTIDRHVSQLEPRSGSEEDATSSSPNSLCSLLMRAKRRLAKHSDPGAMATKSSPIFRKPLFSKSFPDIVAELKPPPKITPELIERRFYAQQERERQELARA